MKEEIKKFFKGEIKADKATIKNYSHDASLFEVKPELVLFPKNSEDVKNLVKWAAENKVKYPNLSITARSAGTDMSGGPLNESIILDFTKYMNKLVAFKGETITVEPGMFYRDFEKITAEKGLFLPSYPASKSICALGGMVSNNSGGEKTLKYGKTENFVTELKVVLADGNEYAIKALSQDQLKGKMGQDDVEGKIYRQISGLINQNRELINKAKPNVSKNSAGYYIWNVNPESAGTFDLNKLIVGSQGTLGIITEITLRLVPVQKESRLVVIFLDKMELIAEIVNKILKYKPESLEAYDDKTLKLAIRFFPSFLKNKNPWRALKFAWSFWPDLFQLIRFGFPKLVMLAEFPKDNLPKDLADLGVRYRITNSAADTGKYFEIRHESFNLLRQHVKGKRTAPFIDDIIVRPEFLPAFLPELNNLLKDYPIEYTLAGHPGDGNFHIIPLMDMKDKRNREIIPELSDKVYDLVLKYHGSITAEHNDGIIRTPYLEKMFGAEITAIFSNIKNIFDPLGILNPGKKTKGDIKYAKKHIMVK
jgi:FAD/FMN-containing dehydrogenase